MFRQLIDRLKFLWSHEHDWVCYPDQTDETDGEKWYWHVHECYTPQCEKRISVLNGACELYQSRGRRNQ